MFESLARVVTRHPWRVVAAWVLAAVVVVAFSPKLTTYTTSNQGTFLPSSYESQKAQDVANREFPAQSGATGSLVVSRIDKGALTSTDQSKISSMVTSLTNDHIPGVSAITASQNSLSSNKKVFLIQVAFKGQPGDSTVNSAVTTLRDKSTAYLKGSGLISGLTGNAAINVDTTAAYAHAETIIGVATIILILLFLGLIFYSVVIAILPIAIILVVHAMVSSLAADLSDAFNFKVGPSLAPILLVVLFGIGTDYIIFLLFRYREQLRAGDDGPVSLRYAAHNVGVVIASAAFTVMAAFATMLLASLGSLSTLAPGLIIAVLVMLAAALTLVPAVFSLLGKHLFWPHGVGEAKESRRIAWIGRGVVQHPGRLALICVLILVALSLGALGYKPTYNTLSELPGSTPSLQAYNTLKTGFPPGALGPTQVYVQGSAALSQSSINPLVTKLSTTKGVASVLAASFSSDKKAALVPLLLKDDPYSTVALDNVQGPIRQAAHSALPGEQVLVGGATSQLVDVRQALGRDISIVFPVALVIIGVILALLLLALAAPLYLLVGVGLSYVATLGVTSLVFLNIGGLSGIDFSTPVVLYLFVVAIGTDYNILMAHRVREETLLGKPANEGAQIAVLHGAPAVQSAAIILAGTFASLMLSGVASLIELGFGVAIGIVITAFIMATRLVPAISALPRWHFWWPSRPKGEPAPEVVPVDLPVPAGSPAGPGGGGA